MDFETMCVHGSVPLADPTGAVSVPIYQTATFAHPGVGQSTGYDYSRVQNPTRAALEKTVAALEGGCEALAFSSGMAAITVMLALFAPGDHIVASDDLYGGTVRLFNTVASNFGVIFEYVDTSIPSALEKSLRPETKAIYLETPTNPKMLVTDIAAAARLARAHGLMLIVDNTFLTPAFQKPIALGADIVIHSGTKYLAGHNDTLAGFLVTNNAILAERLRLLYKTIGACLSPFDSWLVLRGIKTLSVRLHQQQKTALELADWLGSHPKVRAVHYPGLPSHPGYAVSLRQSTGFGAMISFETTDEETARQTLERVRLIQYAESLGGVESLITYPALQTHADLPEQQRASKGIDGHLLRLSVGLETADDLIADLEYALGGHREFGF
ncbi:PLP-dependent aspartate aminotransferase family protein [Oscillospiraceae bacterium WX1]